MKWHILILLIFIGLTLIFTYPLSLHMHSALHEPGDSLFNTWAIAWDIKALLTNPLNIFHTNIFHPYKYTLAYSEHMIGIALMALPLYLFIKNPLFIYNFMLLLSFVLCGWGAYLLTYHLTKDRLSGIVSGIIFAFCPYRYDQLGHLHILTSQWIPFALLFLHRISEAEPRKSYKFGFGFFLLLQFLCSGHNGMYLVVAVALFLIYFRVFPWIILLIVGILILPFYYPYIYLAREMGFERPIYEFKLYSPQFSSYIAVAGENWLYGKYLSKFCRPEAVMFPGLMAIILSFWRRMPKIRIKRNIINLLIALDLLMIILIAITGGIDLGKTIFGVKLKVTDFTRPAYILLILLMTKVKFKDIAKRILTNNGPVKFYWILAITAFILSFGPMIRLMDKDVMWGPYSLLYNFVPGFNGLRVSGRIYTLFILAISVLSGFGVKKVKSRARLFIPFIVLAEYITIPVALDCRVGTKPPLVYKWLARQSGDFAIAELPMPDYYTNFYHEIPYVYWSIYHGKKMINGYSGYSPPSYWPLAEKMKDFPNEEALEILKFLDVKYIIAHEGKLEDWDSAYKLIFKDGEDYLYETPEDMFEAGPRTCPEIGHLYESQASMDEATVRTNFNPEDINKAIDGDPVTRWHSGIMQEPGMYVELDLGKTQKISGVSMFFGDAPTDYPRGIEIEISEDGNLWHEVPLKLIYANYIKHLVKYPKDNRMIIDFEPIEARFVKITQTGGHSVFFWSIYELQVYTVGQAVQIS